MRRSFQSCSEACESSKPQFLPVFLSKGLSAVRRAGFLINIAGSIALKGLLLNAFSGALSNAWEPGVKVYAKKVLGINTHSLRYARITHMLRNISPSIVAKITGHKKLDYILTYTQIKTAEEALRNIK